MNLKLSINTRNNHGSRMSDILTFADELLKSFAQAETNVNNNDSSRTVHIVCKDDDDDKKQEERDNSGKYFFLLDDHCINPLGTTDKVSCELPSSSSSSSSSSSLPLRNSSTTASNLNHRTSLVHYSPHDKYHHNDNDNDNLTTSSSINTESSTINAKFVFTQNENITNTTSINRKNKDTLLGKKEEDLFMIAAHKRLKRKKKQEVSVVELDHKEEEYMTIALSKLNDQGLDDNNKPCNKDMKSSATDRNHDNNQEIMNATRATLGEKNVVDTITNTFQFFLNDVKYFLDNKKKKDDLKMSNDGVKKEDIKNQIETFTTKMDEKYIKLSLDLLPPTISKSDTTTVTKVRKLILRVIKNLKNSKDPKFESIYKLIGLLDRYKVEGLLTTSSPSPSPSPSSISSPLLPPPQRRRRRNTWKCILCLQKDISINHRACTTCGRPRGYRERDYTKDIREPRPALEEKRFIQEGEEQYNYSKKLNKLNHNSLYSKSDDSSGISSREIQEHQYLYNQREFEIESRIKLKADVSALLEDVKDFTI